MLKKTLMVAVLATASLVSVAHAADQQTEQAKQNFEKRLVQPCNGKKAGDQVQVTTKNGVTVMATCTLTAVVNIK